MADWRSVADEMPDDNETVLVYAPDASEPVWPAWFGSVDGGDETEGSWHYIDGVDAEGVTHWAPMPEGPK